MTDDRNPTQEADPLTEAESPNIPGMASERQYAMLVALVDQFARLTKPTYFGLDRIPDRPVMFVGNHTIFAVFDTPFLMAGLWKKKGITLRPLGHRGHWSVPVWREFVQILGTVSASRSNITELMRRGENLLEFPGGASEANKRRGEKYQLIWKNRIGFAKLALEHEYTIVPFAAVGGEEMLDIVVDESNPIHASASRLTRRLVGIPLPSLVRGIGLTPVPRPKQLYFWFGDPIDPGPRHGKGNDGARVLRDEVKHSVEEGIDFLLAERAEREG